MPVSDHQLFEAWMQVLTLSELQPGQTVTILTSSNTHPQTLAMASLANSSRRIESALPSDTSPTCLAV